MPDLVELRFTGEQAVSFLDHGIGHVEPQGTFRVPEEEAERFTRRADVELATPGPRRKLKGAEGAAKESEECSGGDPAERGLLQVGDGSP